MNNPVLVGADAVEQAGRMMLTAAQDMARAANSMERSAQLIQQTQKEMDFMLLNHQRFLNDWLERAEEVLSNVLPTPGEPLDVRIVQNEEEEEEEAVTRSEAPTIPALEPNDTNDLEGPVD
jgi:hypothetical protein